jgi:hypothetical protein
LLQVSGRDTPRNLATTSQLALETGKREDGGVQPYPQSVPRDATTAPGLGISLLVLFGGLAIAVLGLIGTIKTFVDDLFHVTAIVLPADFQRHLDAGHYVVYQRGGIFPAPYGGPGVLLPGDITVTGPEGQQVFVARSGDFEVNNGPADYRSVATFQTPTAGVYRIQIVAPQGVGVAEAGLSRTAGDAAHQAAPWLVALAIGGLIAATGLVLLIVGIARRSRNSKPSTGLPPSTGPPPGWYADPSAVGRYRWWDGRQWTVHTA